MPGHCFGITVFEFYCLWVLWVDSLACSGILAPLLTIIALVNFERLKCCQAADWKSKNWKTWTGFAIASERQVMPGRKSMISWLKTLTWCRNWKWTVLNWLQRRPSWSAWAIGLRHWKLRLQTSLPKNWPKGASRPLVDAKVATNRSTLKPHRQKPRLCYARRRQQNRSTLKPHRQKPRLGFYARRRQHNWSTLLKPRLCYYARRRPHNMSTLQAHRQKPRLYCCARRRQHNVFSLMWGPGFRIHRTRFESAGSFANVGASARLAAHCLPCLKKGVRREGNGQSHNLTGSPLKYLLQK